MPKKRIVIFCEMFLMMLLLSACSITDSSATTAGPQVRMGATTFIDSTITISRGDSVVLVDTVSSTHIVTNGTWAGTIPKPGIENGAPKVNVTVSNAGEQQRIGPFTSTGSFQLYCTIHQDMNLNVSVK